MKNEQISDWRETVDHLFVVRYSCNIRDLGCSEKELAEAREHGEAPDDFVERFATKHDLNASDPWRP